MHVQTGFLLFFEEDNVKCSFCFQQELFLLMEELVFDWFGSVAIYHVTNFPSISWSTLMFLFDLNLTMITNSCHLSFYLFD